MNWLLDPALLADSGPATPSMAPFPNFSGCLEKRFSTSYATKVDTAGPHPGRSPKKKPTADPRIMLSHVSRMSRQVGSQSLIRVS